MNIHLHCVTAESVRRGHPDKFCDQIADRILDAHLTEDPNARVAVEVMASAGRMLVAGEITSKANVNAAMMVTKVLKDIGYRESDISDGSGLLVTVNINEQSPDIASAVGSENVGAGDQGIVVGYATDETPEYMPLPVVLAHKICMELDEAYELGEIPGLGADGKAQVTVLYDRDKPIAISTVVVSVQHREGVPFEDICRLVKEHVVEYVLPKDLIRPNTRFLINPSGRFVKGGPMADTGLTGRKLAVDLYGPVAHIGGGALSGKDCTKTDRSGAYAARWVAKCIVAAGLARRCEVQIAYAIGRRKPVSVDIDTFGTGVIPDYMIEKAVDEVFDLSPGAIIEQLKLNRPIYRDTSVYGHMGRSDILFPWEDTAKKRDLISATIRQNTVVSAAMHTPAKKAEAISSSMGLFNMPKDIMRSLADAVKKV